MAHDLSWRGRPLPECPMRKLALLAVVSATAALTAAGPRPKATFLFSLKDQRARHWALSADLRRVYYFEDPSQL